MTHPTARDLLRKYALTAKKSWGQNFLVDERAYRVILEACALMPSDWAVEIGAGLGTLTRRLAEVAGQVVAIERDRDMVAVLRGELGPLPAIEIAEANALTFDYLALAARAGQPLVVVGNLPYQIASPLLFRLLDARTHLKRVVVMLQKEMVERIVATPERGDYGALSVMLQMAGKVELVARVRAGGFLPVPRVDSAILRVTPFPGGATRVPVRDAAWFSQVVHAAFNQRRKTLRNALKPISEPAIVDAAFAALSIDPRRRGETLSVAEFAHLADAIQPSAHA